ncbi:putative peptidase, putative,metallo-peptidase, Clan ME, Family M16 [Trypanosoma grayi]|uniref:putative peptidase, putative,metallo-peptidase, Clan ME, Family M16 n=1 Tax=Trypanosoma grayi TaxID=71804 RepID=UPI0004F45C12|nr:putative peptidase, putative,metallo-peptidase, Clan ME, Family M16 [Trypanosoma grayi]KEG14039.1 putative peptidase, putative,metallo-peptidase, Clan ME, Family M16 [Trypanosoma grayi]
MSFQREAVQIVTPSVLRARCFGYILGNGVKCIVIQDTDAKIPVAVMNILAGTLNDPEVVPGLAHFCEHMLFMGTAKYPREDEYNSYINKNGGSTNAWTTDMGTTFYFTVAQDALEGALERFVEFFVAPSFNPSSMSREAKAVHSEDEKNHSVDFWRIDELQRSLVDARHPRSRYGNGNITTLWDEPRANNVDVREKLLEFFNTHYVSGAACIAVYSALPPESVLRIIEPPLSRLRAGAPTPFCFLPAGETLLAETAKNMWVNVRTVKKARCIRLLWLVKSDSASWRSLPGAYVSHVLGHECNSSVIGILRRENLATAMLVGPRRIDNDNVVFSVDIELTVGGFGRVVDVVDMVYQGIGQATRVDDAVYAQMKAEARLTFESSDVSSSAVSLCAELAGSANEVDLQHCWIGGDVVLEDDVAAQEAYTAQLRPENCVVMLMWGDMPCDSSAGSPPAAETEVGLGESDSGTEKRNQSEEEQEEEEEEEEEGGGARDLFESLPDFARVPCNSTTRFHHTKFAMHRIPDGVLSRWAASLRGPWHSALALPPVNPFLSTDFTLYCNNNDDDHAGVETFHTGYGVALVRKDTGRHKSFKTSVMWSGLSPCAYASPKNCFYTQVAGHILCDAIAEMSYFGELAALENTVKMGLGGLTLAVTGPQHRLVDFFLAILEKAYTQAILYGSVEKYNIYAEAVVRRLASRVSAQPYELATSKFSKVVKRVMHTFEEVLVEAASASHDEYLSFVKNYLLSGVYFECYVAGNVPSTAYVREHLVRGVEETLRRLQVPPAAKESIPRFRDTYAFTRASLPVPQPPLVDVLSFPPFSADNPNVAVILDIYLGEVTPQLWALCDSMQKLLSSSFFDSLRTRESLGYIVYLQSVRMEGTAHLHFVAQSALDGVDGVYLLSRIMAYLAAVEENLTAVCDDAEVKTVVNGLIEVRRKLPASVEQDCADLVKRYLHPVGLDYKEAEIEALQQVDAATLQNFFHTYIANSSPSRHALAIIINSAASAKNNTLCGPDDVPCEITLPPRRLCEEPPAGDQDPTKDFLQLPDFEAAPMHIIVRKYMSPEMYHQNFPVVPSHSF